jgi:hypothetical protein
MQIAASLQTLEQDLLTGIEKHLAKHPGASSGPALTATVSAYLAEGGRAWRTGAMDLVRSRLQRTSDQTADLLDEVDWAQVNTAVHNVGGQARYPDLIMERLALGAPLSVRGPDWVAGPAAPDGPGSVWVPTLRRAAYGGVAAAVSLVVLGPVLLPAIAAGALGAASGTLADMQLIEVRDRRAAVTYARAAITSTMDEFASTVRATIRQTTGPIRSAVSAEFDVLDSALSSAVQASTAKQHDGATGKSADTAVLADIRRDLRSGHVPSEKRGRI